MIMHSEEVGPCVEGVPPARYRDVPGRLLLFQMATADLQLLHIGHDDLVHRSPALCGLLERVLYGHALWGRALVHATPAPAPPAKVLFVVVTVHPDPDASRLRDRLCALLHVLAAKVAAVLHAEGLSGPPAGPPSGGATSWTADSVLGQLHGALAASGWEGSICIGQVNEGGVHGDRSHREDGDTAEWAPAPADPSKVLVRETVLQLAGVLPTATCPSPLAWLQRCQAAHICSADSAGPPRQSCPGGSP